MARPECTWPIPAYVAELREERTVYGSLPAPALEGRVPSPLLLDASRGRVRLVVTLGRGRCVKPALGERSLLGDFHVLEVGVPVLWPRACRPAVAGRLQLALHTDAPGLRRLLRATLGVETGQAEFAPAVGSRPAPSRVWLRGAAATGFRIPPLAEATLSAEEPAERPAASPEADLAPAETRFFLDAAGGVARAVPVHAYARKTLPAIPLEAPDLTPIAALLGVSGSALRFEAACVRRRCTQTWSFPPERVPLAPARVPERIAA